MKSYTVQGLLEENPKPILIPEETRKIIVLWKKMFEEQIGRKPEPSDYFIFGQTISNPVIKEKFKLLLDKEIKYDYRIQDLR